MEALHRASRGRRASSGAPPVTVRPNRCENGSSASTWSSARHAPPPRPSSARWRAGCACVRMAPSGVPRMRGRVDDHRLLVAAADVALAFDATARGASRGRRRCVASVGDRRARVRGASSSSTTRHAGGQRARASASMVNTAPTFASRHWYAISAARASGFTSTAPRPSLRGERGEERRRRGQQDRRALAAAARARAARCAAAA